MRGGGIGRGYEGEAQLTLHSGTSVSTPRKVVRNPGVFSLLLLLRKDYRKREASWIYFISP